MTQTYKVQVSMNQAAIVKTGLVLKQGDFGMQIEIEVLDFNVTGTTPQIVFRKTQGAVEATTITVSGNKYTYTFRGTELDVPGKVICDLKLKNSSTQRISTASFMFEVEADTLDGLAEEASSYSDTIEQIVDGFDDDITAVNTRVDNLQNNAIPFPVSPMSKYGSNGQNLRTLGNGQTEWVDQGLPTDEQTAQAVTEWLDDHPEATTTVQDHSLTPIKLNIEANQPVNVLTLGVKNDGSEDCSSVINQYTALYDLYFPDGRYLIENPITLKKSIMGSGKERGYSVTHGSWLIDGISSENTDIFLINAEQINEESSISISNINIKLNGLTGGIKLKNGRFFYYRISSVNIIDVSNVGILCYNTTAGGQSRGLYANDISIVGGYNYPNSCGIKNEYFYDCRFSNLEIMKCKIGIYQDAGIFTCSDAHIYCGPRETIDPDDWWNDTIGIYCGIGTRAIFTNLYVDTARKQFECHGSDSVSINGYIYWEDGTVASHSRNNAVICSVPNVNDQTRKMLTIINGYILVTDKLSFVNNINRIKFINVGFRYNNLSNIESNEGYRKIGNGKPIVFMQRDYDYEEIARLYMGNSGYIKLLVGNDRGDYVTLEIRQAIGSSFFTINAIQEEPIFDKIELFAFKEIGDTSIIKIYAKKSENRIYLTVQNLMNTGRLMSLDYLNTYNEGGTQMIATLSHLNEDSVTISNTLPANINGFVDNTLYRLRNKRNIYKSFQELGLTTGQNYTVKNILDKMDYSSYAQLNINSGDISGINSGELYIWKAHLFETIHKSLILLNSTTQSMSNSGDTYIRVGQIHYNDGSISWKVLQLSSQ